MTPKSGFSGFPSLKGSRPGPGSLAQIIPDWPTLKPPDRNKKKKVPRLLFARKLKVFNKSGLHINSLLRITITF